MLKQKVYSGWALKENAIEMSKINKEIYKSLKPKVKMCYVDYRTKTLDCTSDDLQKYCCITPYGHGYGTIKYRVLSNPYGFTKDQLALICDDGNLCYGYRQDGSDVFIIYND